MKEFIKNKLGVPENWDKHDYQLARYSFEDIEEVLLAYEKEQLRLGVVVRQSEQLFCDCEIPKPTDPYDVVDKHICRDCKQIIAK